MKLTEKQLQTYLIMKGNFVIMDVTDQDDPDIISFHKTFPEAHKVCTDLVRLYGPNYVVLQMEKKKKE